MGKKVRIDEEKLELLEVAYMEYRSLSRELEDLGWTALDYLSGRPQEPQATQRRNLAQRARYAWVQDALVGGAITKLNDFVFGRGVAPPKAVDPAVQEVIDEAWSLVENQRVLTSAQAQRELGTDLSIQSNLFLLMFDDGDDHLVKLGLLNHDSVEDAVTDPDNRLRVLYYLATERKQEWDFSADKPKIDYASTHGKKVYYRHYQNVADDERAGRKLPTPPKEKMGQGVVYHVAVNKGMEHVFGWPEMARVLRWATAYNEFAGARVDITKARAAFSMKRKVKGSESQLERLATKALTRQSDLATAYNEEDGVVAPPKTASILNENDRVTWEAMNLGTHAGDAAQDARLMRGQFSAATGWPQHYMGDAETANLATASSLELPVLKLVESRQQVFEDLFRWFIDRVIERAVDSGKIKKTKEPEQGEEETAPTTLSTALQEAAEQRRTVLRTMPLPNKRVVLTSTDGNNIFYRVVREDHEGKAEDEKETERDLSYEFSMPNPLKRLMGDVVNAATGMVQALDPNGTNVDLSRLALEIILREGFDFHNASDVVERIFPEGYDPLAALTKAQQQMQGGGLAPEANFFGPEAAGQPTEPSAFSPESSGSLPYGAKQQATPPEQVQIQQAMALRRRDGELVLETARKVPELARVALNQRSDELDRMFEEDIEAVAAAKLEALLTSERSENGTKGGS